MQKEKQNESTYQDPSKPKDPGLLTGMKTTTSNGITGMKTTTNNGIS